MRQISVACCADLRGDVVCFLFFFHSFFFFFCCCWYFATTYSIHIVGPMKCNHHSIWGGQSTCSIAIFPCYARFHQSNIYALFKAYQCTISALCAYVRAIFILIESDEYITSNTNMCNTITTTVDIDDPPTIRPTNDWLKAEKEWNTIWNVFENKIWLRPVTHCTRMILGAKKMAQNVEFILKFLL